MSIENVEAGIVGQGPDRKTIHLGNLPRGVDKARVEKVLKEKVALEVQPINIEFTNAKYHGPPGFALLTFLEEDQAEYAKNILNGIDIGGRLWLASFPSPNPKEGAGNVYLTFNGGVDKKELLLVLSRYGQIIKHSIKNSHGYVDFGVSEVAEKLIEESKRQPGIVLGENYRLRSKWYLTPEERARDKAFKTVYFSFVPREMTKEKVQRMFEAYGTLDRFELKCTSNGRSEGRGLAKFERPLDAMNAVRSLNGKEVSGEILYARNPGELRPVLRQVVGRVGEVNGLKFAKHDDDQSSVTVTVTYTPRPYNNRKGSAVGGRQTAN